MKKQTWLLTAAVYGTITAITLSVACKSPAAPETLESPKPKASEPASSPLTPPAEGSIPVAFLISDGAVMIDFTGPWEVFQDVHLPNQKMPFHLYTVGETTRPIHASGGMKIVPDYSIANAPTPKVLVIPAQSDLSAATKEWVRKVTKSDDLTMSVCTGAFALASTGLLSGKPATTHHSAYTTLADKYPDIQVKRGARFVETGNLATAGGLSSGIDLALRVVERYYGREAARQTAFDMEYQGEGWMNSESNSVYAQPYAQSEQHPVCPVCGMEVDPKSAPTSVYKGKTYYFMTQEHKQQFEANPELYLKGSADK
ncbi:MAG TPA: DJ-1/PfpI family protein [Candidatus Sulfotelmatobacter sp.]|nr:DJ-1/PfpI family protein [Candidatus Sulfotelmatobacter sp.]